MNENEIYDKVADIVFKYIVVGGDVKSMSEDTGLAISTIKKFAKKETQFPRLHTVACILEYFGYSFTVELKRQTNKLRSVK